MPDDCAGMPSVELTPMVRTLAKVNDGLVLTADLVRTGCSRADIERLLRANALRRVCRGTYLAVDPDAAPLTPEARYRTLVLAAIALRAPRGSTIVPAGPASVVLHGLPLVGRAPAVVHVAAPQSGGRKRSGLISPIGTHLRHEISRIGEIQAASPARAVLDTARVMTTVAGVAAADAALRLGLLSKDDLQMALEGMQRHRGVLRAKKVNELASELSESPGESWSAVTIDALGLPRPERQHSFHDAAGLIGRVDFWWPEQRVVGEFDGRIKYGRSNPSGRAPEDVLWDEKRREDRLRARGLTVVRWTAEELAVPARLDARLRRLLT